MIYEVLWGTSQMHERYSKVVISISVRPSTAFLFQGTRIHVECSVAMLECVVKSHDVCNRAIYQAENTGGM